MSKLHNLSVETKSEDEKLPLPESVQLSLGEIRGNTKEGLLPLSIGTWLGILSEMMEHEVETICGVKGQHDASRKANRRGRIQGEVETGGRRLPIVRPRVRSTENEALSLAIYAVLHQ